MGMSNFLITLGYMYSMVYLLLIPFGYIDHAKTFIPR